MQIIYFIGFVIVTILGLTADFTGSNSIKLITPLPLMFSIWLPIYAGVIGFAFLQLRMRWREHYHIYGVRPWFLCSLFLAGLWSYIFKFNIDWLQIGVALLTVATAYRALWHLNEHRNDAVYVWFVSLPVGLYAGWITLATTLIVSEALNIPGSNILYGAYILGVALIVVALMLYKAHDVRGYSIALVWGLTGIVLNSLTTITPITIVAGIGVLVVLFGLYRKLTRFAIFD
jgi:hypothetical protein